MIKAAMGCTALSIAAAFRARGYLVPLMRPPTVPDGTSRLRWSPSALHTDAELAGACAALDEVLTDAGITMRTPPES